MTQPRLTFQDIARALDRFGTFDAIDVFADDIEELLQSKATQRLPAGVTSSPDGRRLFATLDQKIYAFELLTGDAEGVVRCSRATAAENTGSHPFLGAAIGAAIGQALDKKGGDRWLAGLLLGLMVGAWMGDEPGSPRKVFTLKFDPVARKWTAYDGGLVSWAKSNLAAAT